MLQNRQNQVAAVQIAARRNLDQVALVAGAPHLPSQSKHRLYWSMYGKRPTSPTQPTTDPQSLTQTRLDQDGSGNGHCQCTRLRSHAVAALTMLRESERRCTERQNSEFNRSGNGNAGHHNSEGQSVVSQQQVMSDQSAVMDQSSGTQQSRMLTQVMNVPVATTTRSSVPVVTTAVWQIPATAWAAFAIQKAIRG